jgi:hypothetical protein
MGEIIHEVSSRALAFLSRTRILVFLVFTSVSGRPPGGGGLLPTLSSPERSRRRGMLVSGIKFGTV